MRFGVILTFATVLTLSIAPVARAWAADDSASAATDAKQSRALDLARVLNSEASVRKLLDRMFRDTLPAALAADANFKSLEADMPGISNEMIAVMQQILVEAGMQQLPALHADAAEILARNLTLPELQTFLDFYQSPVGQKLVTNMQARANFRGLVDDQLASGGEKPITANELRGVARGAVAGSVATLSVAERAEVVRFSNSSGGRKLPAISRELFQLSARFANAPSPATDAKIEKALNALIDRRAAEKGK